MKAADLQERLKIINYFKVSSVLHTSCVALGSICSQEEQKPWG